MTAFLGYSVLYPRIFGYHKLLSMVSDGQGADEGLAFLERVMSTDPRLSSRSAEMSKRRERMKDADIKAGLQTTQDVLNFWKLLFYPDFEPGGLNFDDIG
ncbi:MAG: hypothetical protein MMC33_010703 [Icmadophila ericetorum]|nr:hypothetical protein [Icmadophila ericetorum]